MQRLDGSEELSSGGKQVFEHVAGAELFPESHRQALHRQEILGMRREAPRARRPVGGGAQLGGRDEKRVNVLGRLPLVKATHIPTATRQTALAWR
jgi:hypothetical protein